MVLCCLVLGRQGTLKLFSENRRKADRNGENEPQSKCARKNKRKNYVRKANELCEEAELRDNCVGSSL